MFRNDALPCKGALLAIDFGKARVGLAKTDAERFVVTPLETLEAKGISLRALAERIADRAKALECVGLVLGWPDEDDDSTLPLRKEICTLAEQLRQRHSLPCASAPESFSSRDALMYLHEAKKKKKDRARLDHYAAAVILERYLDASR
ncbi:MAG: Holliday junction resolvase RuvX [Spirochaetota bacterium]|nr:Holliday junction resolvase RuvX [Spirochaetota bacterium]